MSSYLSLQFKYVIFYIFTRIFTIYGYITNSKREQFSVSLIAQLVERCTGIGEVMGSNTVHYLFFSLQTSHLQRILKVGFASQEKPLSSKPPLYLLRNVIILNRTGIHPEEHLLLYDCLNIDFISLSHKGIPCETEIFWEGKSKIQFVMYSYLFCRKSVYWRKWFLQKVNCRLCC